MVGAAFAFALTTRQFAPFFLLAELFFSLVFAPLVVLLLVVPFPIGMVLFFIENIKTTPHLLRLHISAKSK